MEGSEVGCSLFCGKCEALDDLESTPVTSSTSQMQAVSYNHHVAIDLYSILLAIEVQAAEEKTNSTKSTSESSDEEQVDPLSFLIGNEQAALKPKSDDSRGRRGKAQLCSNCRKPGHKRRTCPSLKAMEKQSAKSAMAPSPTPNVQVVDAAGHDSRCSTSRATN